MSGSAQTADGDYAGRTILKPLSLGIRQTCEVLGIGRTKLWELITEGRLETFMIGRKRLVVFESIERLMRSGARSTRANNHRHLDRSQSDQKAI